MEPRFPPELDTFTEPDAGLMPRPRHAEPESELAPEPHPVHHHLDEVWEITDDPAHPGHRIPTAHWVTDD